MTFRLPFMVLVLAAWFGPGAIGQPEKQSVKLIFVNQFKDKLGRTDTLSKFGGDLLVFYLGQSCEALFREKQLSLETSRTYSVRVGAGKEIVDLTEDEMDVTNLSMDEIVFVVITVFQRFSDRYVVHSSITRPVKDRGKLKFDPLPYAVYPEIPFQTNRDGTISVDKQFMQPLAEGIADGLHELLNMDRKVWRVYADSTASSADSLREQWQDLPGMFLSMLQEERPFLIEAAESEDAANARLNVAVSTHPMIKTKITIDVNLALKNQKAHARGVFHVHDAASFDATMKSLVDKLLQRMDRLTLH